MAGAIGDQQDPGRRRCGRSPTRWATSARSTCSNNSLRVMSITWIRLSRSARSCRRSPAVRHAAVRGVALGRSVHDASARSRVGRGARRARSQRRGAARAWSGARRVAHRIHPSAPTAGSFFSNVGTGRRRAHRRAHRSGGGVQSLGRVGEDRNCGGKSPTSVPRFRETITLA